ncbi:MAG: hypothetical protein KJ600_01780 [Nanoarchaeota archaeon]|nr:hypothetical protein [Nanoarchaeota archaeon]MBU1103267.1 hypothetical protein [Nanoarchaeota archaeon]
MTVINRSHVISGVIGAVITWGALFGLNSLRPREGTVEVELDNKRYAVAVFTERLGKRTYDHISIFSRSEPDEPRDVKVSEIQHIGEGSYLETYHLHGGFKIGVAHLLGLPEDISNALSRS